MRTPLLLSFTVLTMATPGLAQSVPPRPDDVGSLDGIMAAFYDVISGPAGAPRQWDRDRTLYWPGIRFFSLSVRDGTPVATVMAHDEYLQGTNDWMVANGFFEIETSREVDRFGNMAHVWSSYQYRQTPDGPVTGRGINSVQLLYDGARWWITAVTWDNERPGNPMPSP